MGAKANLQRQCPCIIFWISWPNLMPNQGHSFLHAMHITAEQMRQHGSNKQEKNQTGNQIQNSL